MTETENKEELIKAISPYFHIREEIWGKHLSGDNVRIDMVLMPKDNSKWRNKNKTAFGVEIKPDYDSFNEITGVIVQSIDYRYSKFNGFHIPILMYPNIFRSKHFSANKTDWMLDRLIGKMNIGVIDKVDYKKRIPEYFEFRMSDIPIWCNRKGVHLSGQNRKFEFTFGRQ